MIASSQEELWEEYYRLRKQLVLEKKLNIWNEVAEKDFWVFVGWRAKGRKRRS